MSTKQITRHVVGLVAISILIAAASPGIASAGQYPVRGIYHRDVDRQAAIGFNFIDSGPYNEQMDVLAARGLKGFLWLGGYSNTTCQFAYSDDWVRSHVSAVARHPAVGAYFIDDEPNAAMCPGAPAQMKARSDLVKSIDPGPPTFIVTSRGEQLRLFAGKVDVLGLARYPCSFKSGCDYSKIPTMAAEADRLGIRYWGVLQAFTNSWYSMPTPAQLHEQFVRWQATKMQGYLVYAWRSPAGDPSRWLANNQPLVQQLALENGGDMTAPTAPTGLAKTAETAISVDLAWSASSDAVGLAGYGLYVDGTGVGTTSGTSHSFSGLSCGRTYTLSVDAYDAAGNRSAKVSLGAATSACAATRRSYAIRGIYDRDIDRQAAIGFNYIDSGAYKDQMDVLAARGLKGLIWLGGYSNTTCTFTYSDDWVRSHVAAIARHPGVGAYFIDDEPDAVLCPGAPAQVKARSDLVKSIDPGPPTFIVTNRVDHVSLFAGKVDVIGLDRYPCSFKNGCDYSKIDGIVAEAERLGVRYWGVIQAFSDSWYRMPTPEELHQQFVRWRATNMEGYLVFAWRFPASNPSLWLANNPAVQGQFALENAG